MGKRERTGYYAVPHLRRLREEAILTQEQLARAAGVSRATIVAAEGGQTVRIYILEKLAHALQVDKHRLVTGSAAEDRDAPQA